MKYRIIKNGLDEFKVEQYSPRWPASFGDPGWDQLIATTTLEEAEKYLKDYKKQMLDEKIRLEKRLQITVMKEEEF